METFIVNRNFTNFDGQSGNTGRDIGTSGKYFDDVYADDFHNINLTKE